MSAGTLWTLFWFVHSVLVGVSVIIVLRRPREPRAMIAWIFALLFLPVVGLLAFELAGEPRYARTRRRRHRRRQRVQPGLSRQAELRESRYGRHGSGPIRAGAYNLEHLATRLSRRAPTFGNDVAIYFNGPEKFNALCKAVAAARHHIHLEYFIYQPDDAGKQLRDLLLRKVQEGVQVRLLVDSVGCWKWKRAFARSFLDGGIKVAFHMPVFPPRWRWRVNFRNHRKIAVIDGTVGFVGSQNIGDEYRGRREKYGPWRDTHLRIIGPSVQELQEIFVEDWYDACQEDLTDDAYFPELKEAGPATVQVIASGPDMNAAVLHHLLLAAVGGAQRRVMVITPYFAPDTTMLLALQSAAYRGVKVQLLIPSISDQKLTLWSGRSFYPELIETGVEICEYDHALLHSKVMVVDDAWALVGSANMDQRSFRMSFEVTTILYDQALALQLCADFEARWAEARRIDPHQDKPDFGESLLLGLARMASPML